MNKKYILDSSVLISLCSSSEQFYSQSRDFFEKTLMDDAEFIMPEIIYLETINVLQRNLNLSLREVKGLYDFLDSPVFKWISIDQLFRDGFKKYISKVSLKTADAIILVAAKLRNGILISWDKRLLREAKKLKIPAFTP